MYTSLLKNKFHISLSNKAFKNTAEDYDIELQYQNDYIKQLHLSRKSIKEFIRNKLKRTRIKYSETLEVYFNKPDGSEGQAIFTTPSKSILNNEDIETVLAESVEEIEQRIDTWIAKGSNWLFDHIVEHKIHINKYNPLRGSGYIELPEGITKNPMNGLVNIKNNDDKCFLWCHVAYLVQAEKNPNRITNLYIQKAKELNYENVSFPVSIKDVPKIEEQNNISINVFGFSNKELYPLYLSARSAEPNCNYGAFDLLLITNESSKHYVWIKDFNRFCFKQTKHKNKKYFCRSCLQCFSSNEILEKHKDVCLKINGKQSVKLPEKGTTISFNNWKKQLQVPFVIYADFESINKKVNEQSGLSTKKLQSQEACSYGYKVICSYDESLTKSTKIYRGTNSSDIIYKFLEDMFKKQEYCKEMSQKHFNKEIIMTDLDTKDFQKAETCHICNLKFDKNDKKCADHCHVTGSYRGAAHNNCNLQYKLYNKIPIIFHNLRGYDSHLIMQKLGQFKKDIDVIPNNMEKYMAFMVDKLVFIDSFQFMPSSLEKLVSNLCVSDMKYLKSEFGDHVSLLSRKGVYPYDYLDSFGKFDDPKLPEQRDFYSILNESSISSSDYEHAKNVFHTLECKTIGDYHDIYLKTDILLLADVFENFRKTCMSYYKLDPCHYFSSPGLSWDAMLKKTGIKLELISDIDMYLFIESGLRGGISYVSCRYAKANHKYLKDYCPDEESVYLSYLDANNLYGYAMSQSMPTGKFRWLTQNEIDKLDLSKYSNDSQKGLLLEVDLEYPPELHPSHSDYPVAQERIVI